MATNGMTVTIDVLNIPEMIAAVRHEMASILRDEADAEADPRLARRLRALAAAFECGTRPGHA